MKRANTMHDGNDRSPAFGRRLSNLLRFVGWRDRVLLSLVAVFTLLIQLRAPV